MNKNGRDGTSVSSRDEANIKNFQEWLTASPTPMPPAIQLKRGVMMECQKFPAIIVVHSQTNLYFTFIFVNLSYIENLS